MNEQITFITDGPNVKTVNRFGRNNKVDPTTLPETVWQQGGVWVPPTAARVHSVVSTSASDSSAGIGARTVRVTGLDTNYVEQSETITLNGLTPVLTTLPYRFIDGTTTIMTAGSTGTTAGDLIFTAQVDATVSARILAGTSAVQSGVYIVPAGFTAYLIQWRAEVQQATSSAQADIDIETKAFGTTVYRTLDTAALFTGGTTSRSEYFVMPPRLNEKDIIRVSVPRVDTANTRISSFFSLYLLRTIPI